MSLFLGRIFLIINFLDQFDIIDPDYHARSVETLLPTNPIWKRQKGANMQVGLLLEVQTVGCHTDMLRLAKSWWPLTAATVSRSLNVSF